jgi:hypothetical protein
MAEWIVDLGPLHHNLQANGVCCSIAMTALKGRRGFEPHPKKKNKMTAALAAHA